MSSSIIESVFSLSSDVRYVAIYQSNHLESASRTSTVGASSSESDKYEELLVNPTLLTLAKQRGDIDCGGMRFLLIRYGNFYQFVRPITNGHISICIEADADVHKMVESIENLLNQQSNDR